MSDSKNINIRSNKGKTKAKYKFTVMDYITIGFTAAVVLLMVFFLLRSIKPEWFNKKNKNSGSVATATANGVVPTEDPSVVTPTEEPEYSGIGNTYGNMANGAVAAEIDGHTYFVREADKQLCVRSESEGTSEGEARALTSGESAVSSVNVIKDPFSYGDIAGSVAYLVTYIDGEGSIRAITDGPYPAADSDAELDSEPRATEPKTLAEGQYTVFTSVGQYLYAIDRDGLIWRIAIATGERAALAKGKYTALCVYYGELFALGQDGGVYRLALTPSAQTETDTEHSDDSDKLIIAGPVRCFTIHDDWLYTGGDNGFVRYDIDTLGKDTLSTSVKPDAINVDKRGIFFAVDGELKLANARELLSGSGRTLGTWDNTAAPGITLTADNALVLLTDSAGNTVLKSFETE
jgi:hypothetical protein